MISIIIRQSFLLQFAYRKRLLENGNVNPADFTSESNMFELTNGRTQSALAEIGKINSIAKTVRRRKFISLVNSLFHIHILMVKEFV